MAYFLLRKIGADLRGALERDSEEAAQPIQETVRSILCAHYGLECSPIDGHPNIVQRAGATTIVVKMQPELFSALKEEAAETGEHMRALVLDALKNHYNGVVT